MGIDIGGTDTKIGLVDVHQKLIDAVCIPTEAEKPVKEVIQKVGERALELLEKNGIPMDQCVGAGIGVPGTVDRKAGVVRYSNNIRWEEVRLADEIGKYLPIPVEIANNADCAALGEAVAGAGKECSDVVMLTLGTGVGGGIILDGEIYEGRGMGGSELGHMVIVENGEPCTCGRRGCLEAYVSITALKREAYRAAGKEMDQEEIFALAEQGDPEMKKVVDTYIRRLGLGIVNIVNIFRPQLVLLGGDIPKQGEALLSPLRRIVEEECFGRDKGDVPEIEEAILGREAGMIGAAGLV
ncbi:MAG TPA: ROK family protein [Candidatus Blautia pullistercoris]|uniref:ROK family protein n=1 Tax=Candidatus Blautia pullistercoris TaxID=2838499 RepID=A0A9D1VJ44_9FIRM|nr:ROK family protein [Candidatus Blautia pullistercoris]